MKFIDKLSRAVAFILGESESFDMWLANERFISKYKLANITKKLGISRSKS